jgi:hypothetical protein
MYRHSAFKLSILIISAFLVINAPYAYGQPSGYCQGTYDCIGMVIDSGDPVLIQMGHEMSNMVTDPTAGTFVKPTAGPIANVRKVLSRENAGLSVVPSDMLQYTERMDVPVMRRARDYLRFIMTIGRKSVHVLARKEIKGLEDLQGKRVVMGPDNTAIWVVSNNLLHLYGVTPAERIQLKPKEGIIEVLLNRADAVFIIGDAPHPVVQRLAEMRNSDKLRQHREQVHMLPIKVPETSTEYVPVTVNYPGFAENVATVAILPTLISYDFSLKSTLYFRRRCRELAEIGETVRNRLKELRESGHKQWAATSWELEAGDWQKDPCFFGTAKAQTAGGLAKARAPGGTAKKRTTGSRCATIIQGKISDWFPCSESILER